MAAGTTTEANLTASPNPNANYLLPMALMVCLYFSIGFITALNDILVPHFKDLFHLTQTLALLVQFCFFGAYFVMSMPSGFIVGRIGYKPSMIPASILISYPMFLFALFIVGSGFALLQVAINPYVSVLGPAERGPWRINICGIFNSSATTVAPKVGAFFIFIAAGATTAQLARSVRMPYVIVACFTLFVALLTALVPLPKLIQTVKESVSVKTQGSAWSFTHLRFGALGIFSSVGSEVAIGSILINFLGQPAMGALSHKAAAGYVSLYWGGAMVGRIIGSVALLKVKAQHALLGVSCAASLMVLITIFGHGQIAIWAIVSCGLFNSVMWPCIFPLAVKGLGQYTSQGSGILVTMVVGGAIVPELQGFLSDYLGYQTSFAIVLCCYLYLVFFALRGYKIRQPRFATVPDYVPPVEAI
jgi:FHS family L-fucose permease-like MFS transporter